MMKLLLRGIRILDGTSEYVGRAVSWLNAGLVLLICVSVTMRYAFNESRIYLDELQWHLFSLVFLLGAAYALKHDRHVRVDVFYQRFSPKGQAWINLLGTLLFLVPFCLLVVRQSWVFAERAYLTNESSADPGGLPARYLIKGALVVGFVLLLLQALSVILRSLHVIFLPKASPTPSS